MGKNHKHKKRLKAEKAKTQLKNAAKELLKRQNITNTEFKVKPIVIAPQLQARTTEEGRKDLDVKEVAKRMEHRNENMKIRACQDMEYLIKTSKINISYYFKVVCHFIQEEMPNARKAGLKLLKLMLSEIDESNTSDFLFKFLLNHLRCAMTSINRRIIEDSVLFFDVLLEYLPNHMAKHFDLILPDFLMLISALKHDAELRRTVTINLESKFTSAQWRIAVLSRLHLFLDVIFKRRMKKEEGMQKLKDLYDRFPLYVCIENNWSEEMLDLEDECKYDVSKENTNIHVLFQNVFSILYEIWLEGRPMGTSTDDVTYLSDETALLFNCVVQTYHILSSYLRNTKLMMKIKTLEHEKLIRNLVQHLPYSLINKPKKYDKFSNLLSKFVITDIKCTNDNILLCYNYLILFSGNPSKAKKEEIKNVANTITGYLSRDYIRNKKMDFTILFLILRHLFIEKARLWCRNKFPVGDILSNAIILYNEGNLEIGAKLELTRILASICYEDLLGNENFASWLQNLPKHLLEDSINADLLVIIINRIRTIPKDQNVSFYKGILDNYISIYNNLPNLKVHNMTELDVINRKYQIATFVAYLPEPCPQLKSLFEKLDTKNPHWNDIEHLKTERNDGK